jgi:energy-converting hydrogenase Eha subunit F
MWGTIVMKLVILAAIAALVSPSVSDAQTFVMRTPLKKMAAATPAAPAVRKLSCPSSPTNQHVYSNPNGSVVTSFSTPSASAAVAWANQQTPTHAYAHFSYNGSIANLYQTNTPQVFDMTQRWTSVPTSGWYVCSV